MMFFSVFLFIALIVINQANGGRILFSSSNATCTTAYGTRLLNEGEKLIIDGKFYKVEDCHLQRAYQTCGTNLWFMINIVCEAIDIQRSQNKFNNRIRRFAQQKLLTEACCETSCTVAEMTRYCP